MMPAQATIWARERDSSALRFPSADTDVVMTSAAELALGRGHVGHRARAERVQAMGHLRAVLAGDDDVEGSMRIAAARPSSCPPSGARVRVAR